MLGECRPSLVITGNDFYQTRRFTTLLQSHERRTRARTFADGNRSTFFEFIVLDTTDFSTEWTDHNVREHLEDALMHSFVLSTAHQIEANHGHDQHR